MTANSRIITLDDPEKGAVKQLGPLCLFSETPSKITASAPRLGQHNSELRKLIDRKPGMSLNIGPSARPDAGSGQKPPLDGFTILELANYLAAPLGSTPTLSSCSVKSSVLVISRAGRSFRTSRRRRTREAV